MTLEIHVIAQSSLVLNLEDLGVVMTLEVWSSTRPAIPSPTQVWRNKEWQLKSYISYYLKSLSFSHIRNDGEALHHLSISKS